MHGFLLLGSVVLCITGGEALYADMGHFGRTPIRVAWSAVVFPGLLLNYFGQGALFLEDGAKVSNPFYDLVSGTPFLFPMVILATMAAIIASQALISGAFSLTHQAVQLGYLPRVSVVHTSHKHEGQIYIPEVNWLLMVVVRRAGVRVQVELEPGRGLRHRGDRHDGDHVVPVLPGDAAATGATRCTSRSRCSSRSSRSTWRSSPPTSRRSPPAAGSRSRSAIGAFTMMTTWWRGRHELSKHDGERDDPRRAVPRRHRRDPAAPGVRAPRCS